MSGPATIPADPARFRAATLAQVIAIVETEIPRLDGDVTESTVFDRVGLDSLDVMSLIVELEDCFRVEIPDRRIDRIASVADLVDAIDDALGNSPSAKRGGR